MHLIIILFSAFPSLAWQNGRSRGNQPDVTSQVIGACNMSLSDKVPTKLDRLSMFVFVYHHIPSLKCLFNIHTITHMVIGVYILVISLFLDHYKKKLGTFQQPSLSPTWPIRSSCTAGAVAGVTWRLYNTTVYFYWYKYSCNIYIYIFMNVKSNQYYFNLNFIIAIHISFVEILYTPRPLDS